MTLITEATDGDYPVWVVGHVTNCHKFTRSCLADLCPSLCSSRLVLPCPPTSWSPRTTATSCWTDGSSSQLHNDSIQFTTLPSNHRTAISNQYHSLVSSVVVKDFRVKDKDNDKDFMSKNEDLKISPRGSSRTRTFPEDNNTAVRQYGEIDMNLNLTGAQWQTSHPFVTQSLQAYSIIENFWGLPTTRTRTVTWKLVLEDPRGQGLLEGCWSVIVLFVFTNGSTTLILSTIVMFYIQQTPVTQWHTNVCEWVSGFITAHQHNYPIQKILSSETN